MDAVGRNMTLRIAKDVRVSMATALILETKLDFQCKIRQVQSWRGIPNDLIINFDKTPLHEEGAKPAQFAVSITGGFVLVQLIIKLQHPRFLPKNVNFPIDFDVTFTSNHRSNHEKTKQLFEKVIFP